MDDFFRGRNFGVFFVDDGAGGAEAGAEKEGRRGIVPDVESVIGKVQADVSRFRDVAGEGRGGGGVCGVAL